MTALPPFFRVNGVWGGEYLVKVVVMRGSRGVGPLDGKAACGDSIRALPECGLALSRHGKSFQASKNQAHCGKTVEMAGGSGFRFCGESRN